MDTNSYAAHDRIRQLLSNASVDPVTIEADIYHEFGLSIVEAVRLLEHSTDENEHPD
jgi:hypothetical protein